jgi:hypothetical protein
MYVISNMCNEGMRLIPRRGIDIDVTVVFPTLTPSFSLAKGEGKYTFMYLC